MVPIFMSLEGVMDGFNATDLKMVILYKLFSTTSGMQNDDVFSRKFLSFGGDGVSVFQNYFTCVIIQIQA